VAHKIGKSANCIEYLFPDENMLAMGSSQSYVLILLIACMHQMEH